MPSRLQSARRGCREEDAIPFGKYELLERINIGGMAEIVKARDLSQPAAPIVAVKRILPHLVDDRQFVAMFRDESRLLSQLTHENVIHTLEVGEVGETPFIALEYVFGQDARTLFHRGRRNEQPAPMGLACFIMAEVAAALHYAHERRDGRGELLGLVHRDVSLQNILISYDGAVKLTDFGIAMSAENRARTEAGIVKGKFGYMSPEQIRGEVMDRRSDVFAAGICLYELLTGERLFSGDSDYAAVEKVRNVVIDPPSRKNRQIPSGLEALVMKALSKHPRDRFQTAAELRRALLEFMSEGRSEGSQRELAQHMRAVFAEELRAAPTPDVLRRDSRPRQNEEPTGLAAFDDLDPVSALSSQSAVHESRSGGSGLSDLHEDAPPPSVPPVWPRRDSVPAPASAVYPLADTAIQLPHEHAAGVNAVGIGLDWDEDEQRTAGEGTPPGPPPFSPLPGEPGDDDVTRQIRIDETYSGVGVLAPSSGVRLLSRAPAGASPFDGISPERLGGEPTAQVERSVRSMRPASRPSPETSYTMVVAIVVGIVGLIAGGLWATRGSRTAELRLTTEPIDAQVYVDGKVLGARAPLLPDAAPLAIASDLEPNVPHAIEVRAAGFRTWSTSLSLSPGQVLTLPRVALVPENEDNATETAAAAPQPEPAPEPAPERPAAPAIPRAEAQPAEAARPSASERVKSARIRPAPAARADTSQLGKLRLNSRPWSQVAIDGKPVGTTPLLDYPLAAGTHSVQLQNPEFGLKKSLKIQIEADQTLTKVVDLQ